jgi:hypothetical protein
VTDAPLSISFLRYYPGIRLRVPVSFVDDDDNPDLKRGNIYVAKISKFVEVTCGRGIPIPRNIPFSLLNAKNRDVVRVKDLKLPSGVALSKKADPEAVLAVIQSG